MQPRRKIYKYIYELLLAKKGFIGVVRRAICHIIHLHNLLHYLHSSTRPVCIFCPSNISASHPRYCLVAAVLRICIATILGDNFLLTMKAMLGGGIVTCVTLTSSYGCIGDAFATRAPATDRNPGNPY